MSISVKCQCGMTFQAKPELAGKRVKCGSCKAPILIPQSGQSTGPPPSTTSEVFVACQCGQQFKVATQYAGQQVNCPKCQVSLTVPGGASPPSPSTGFPVLDGGGNPKTRQPQAPIPNQSGFSPPASRDVSLASFLPAILTNSCVIIQCQHKTKRVCIEHDTGIKR